MITGFARSTDGGATFSPGVEISGTSDACVLGNLFDPTEAANECNFDQGSWPVAGPDGTLYVFFNNNNTPTEITVKVYVPVRDVSWSSWFSVTGGYLEGEYTLRRE